MHHLLQLMLVLMAAAVIPATAANAELSGNDELAQLLGPWKVKNGNRLLLVTPEQMISHQSGEVVVAGIVRYEAPALWIRIFGSVLTMQVVVREGALHVEVAGETTQFEPLDEIPKELKLEPLSLGQPAPLSEERKRDIREELAERAAKDQEVRRDPSRREELPAIDAANTSYLKALAQEVGWIDVGRFGEKAAHDAFLLTQHSMDLALMMAALPRIEADVEADGALGTELALLHDRVRLLAGQRQRYGTHWQEIDDERWLLPLEDPERVDEFRKGLGLPPLEDLPVLPDGE